jgi:hypothetical protein
LPELLVGAQYLGGTVAALGGAIYVRRSGQMAAGYGLLLLFIACVYATYQNFENPPLWMLLLAPMLFALRPETAETPFRERARTGIFVCSILATAYAVPLAATMTMTTLRALSVPSETIALDLGRNQILRDVRLSENRNLTISSMADLTQPGEPFSGIRTLMSDDQRERVVPAPEMFRGQPVPECQFRFGFAGANAVVAKALERLDARVFVADVVAPHWVFADVPRLEGAAPWNYGSLKGLENAEYLIVPACANSTKTRRAVLDTLDAEEIVLKETMRTPLFTAYRVGAE